MSCPSLLDAIKLQHDFMTQMSRKLSGFDLFDYHLHSEAVANNAVRIAEHIKGMDLEKAYILGLLHDYGEYFAGFDKNLFHGTAGYDFFQNLGYDEMARICLTHGFMNPDFSPSDYSYPQQEVIRAKKLISDLEYDDYDRLIQLSDLLVSGCFLTPIKKRMVFIRDKYKIPLAAIRRKYKEALKVKFYFDKKCGKDIYEILGIGR